MRKLQALRQRLGPLWWHSGLLIVASRLGDVLNLYTATFVLPGYLSAHDLGSVEPVTRLAGMAAIPLTVLSMIGAKLLSSYLATGAEAKVRRFARDVFFLAAASSVVFIILLTSSFNAIRVRLGLDSHHALLPLCGLAAITCWQPAVMIILQGLQRFRATAVIFVIDPILRLSLSLLLVPGLHLTGYLTALFVTGLGVTIVGMWAVKDLTSGGGRGARSRAEWRELLAFAAPATLFVVSGSFQGFIEPFVIKHFLPTGDAAGYYVACRFGYVPIYFVSAISFVLFPLLSHRHERGESTARYLRQAMWGTAGAGLAGTLVLGGIADWLFGLRADWRVYMSYAPQVWKVGLMACAAALAGIYATHEAACRRFSFLWVVTPMILIETVILYGSFGWGAFRGLLPDPLWTAIYNGLPRTLDYALGLMLAARIITLLGLGLHRWVLQRRDVR